MFMLAVYRLLKTGLCFTMILGFSFMLTACAGKKAQTARLELPSNPTTGYEWQAVQEADIFEISSEYVEEKKDSDIVGAGGRQIFTLKPKEKGTTKVTFTYSRPWEKNEDDDRLTYELKVSGNMQIKVMSMTGGLSGTIDEVPALPGMEIE